MSHPISTKDRTFIGQQNNSSGTAEVDPLVNTAELWRMSQMTPPYRLCLIRHPDAFPARLHAMRH